MPRPHTSDQASLSPDATPSWKGADAVGGQQQYRVLTGPDGPFSAAHSQEGKNVSLCLWGFERNKHTESGLCKPKLAHF